MIPRERTPGTQAGAGRDAQAEAQDQPAPGGGQHGPILMAGRGRARCGIMEQRRPLSAVRSCERSPRENRRTGPGRPPPSSIDSAGSRDSRPPPRYLAALMVPEFMDYRPRSLVEDDPSLKQIIPYVIFRSGDAVFCYRRGQSQGEAQAAPAAVVGVGGHVGPRRMPRGAHPRRLRNRPAPGAGRGGRDRQPGHDPASA